MNKTTWELHYLYLLAELEICKGTLLPVHAHIRANQIKEHEENYPNYYKDFKETELYVKRQKLNKNL
jgi:hypothetical protein